MSPKSPLGALLHLIDGAVAVLQPDGAVIAASQCFERLTGKGDVVRIDKRRRPAFRDPAVQASFTYALGEVRKANGASEPVAFPVGTGSTSLTAVLRFLSDASERGDGPSLLLVLCENERRNCVTDAVLKLHYQLSTAEVDVVQKLVDGHKIEDAAEMLDVKVSTARNQLAAAMSKMGVDRQVELVNAVASLAPRLRLGRNTSSGS